MIVNAHARDAKMQASGLKAVSAKTKVTVAKVDMDVTWAFLSKELAMR